MIVDVKLPHNRYCLCIDCRIRSINAGVLSGLLRDEFEKLIWCGNSDHFEIVEDPVFPGIAKQIRTCHCLDDKIEHLAPLH